MYFIDILVPALEMEIKQLIPIMDPGSRRLVNWMDKAETCFCDALKKKYLKTLVFCICEKDEGPVLEEYVFSFSYPSTSLEEVEMRMTHMGSKMSTTFKASAIEVTPNQMRSSACKMIRTLVPQTRTYPIPEERTIVMKLLLFYNDATPEDYEPPFLKYCVDNEAVTIWNKSLLKMEVGNINSKHLVLALKVKSVQSCEKNNVDDDCSNYETRAYETDGYTIAPNDETEDDNHKEVLTSQMKAWNSTGTGTIDVSYNFHDMSMRDKRKTGFVLVSSSKKIKFFLDSGASHHVCNDKAIMRKLKDVKEEYQVPVASCGGVQLKAEIMGTVATKDFKLSQVGYIPDMAFNVVSVGQLATQGLITSVGDSHFSIIATEEARVVGEGYLQKKREIADGKEYHEYVFKTLEWDVVGDDEKLIEPCQEYENRIDQEKEEQEWVIDMGCGRHMVPKIAMLNYARREEVLFQAASGVICSTHKGLVKEGKLILTDVLCCPGVKKKLISVPMLDLSGHRLTFNGERCTIVHKDGLKLRGFGLLEQNSRIYLLKSGEDKRAAAAAAAAAAAEEEPKNLASEGHGRTSEQLETDAAQEADAKKRANAQGKGKSVQTTKRRRLS